MRKSRNPVICPASHSAFDQKDIHHTSHNSLQYLMPLLCLLCLSACGGVQLIDIPKSTAALNLSEGQREKITPQIALIRDIAEDYKFEKNELMADYHRYRSNMRTTRLNRYEGVGVSNRTIYLARSALRTKFRNFITQRQRFIKEITEIVEEIRGTLTAEQLAAFEEIKLPTLELPNMLKRRPNEEFLYVPGTRFGRWDDF